MEENLGPAEVGGVDERKNAPVHVNPNGEGVPIPPQVRRVEDIQRQDRLSDDYSEGYEEEVIREYESRYNEPHRGRRSRLEAGSPYDEIGGTPPRYGGRSAYPSVKAKRAFGEVTENERKWAALAHASTLLTALVALGSAGAGVLLTMFVPLLIYFGFRKRSQYVAFHALQAFTIQLIGTVGWVALILSGTLVWVALVVLSALLILALVGILLLPIVLILGPLFFVASLALPVGMVIYSVIATVQTWQGHDYKYPMIGRWVESQITEERVTAS